MFLPLPLSPKKNSSPDPLQWTSDAQQSLERIKTEFTLSPTLEHPNYNLPFHLSTQNLEENALGALTQPPVGQNRPIGYSGQQLDPIAQGLPLASGQLLLFPPL